MKSNAVIVVLLALVLLLFGWSAYQHQQIVRLQAGLAAAQIAVSQGPEQAAATPALKAKTDRDAELIATSAPPRRPSAVVSSPPPPRVTQMDMPLEAAPPAAVPRAPGGRATNGVPPMQAIAKMMKDPAMRELMRAQQKGTLDLTHGVLFKYLQLPPEQLEAFKAILLDKQMALVDASLDLMDGSVSAQERTAKAEEIAALSKDYDAKISAMLGDEDFAVYQEYEATQPERMQVDRFKKQLDAANALDEAKEDELIRALYVERTNTTFSLPMDPSKPVDPTALTPETMTKYLDEYGHQQDRALQRAASILTSAQLEEFRRSVAQQRAMMEMGMKMAAQMFGRSSDEAQAPAAP